MKMQKNKILITGAGGFIGRALMRAFRAEGHQVFGVDLVEDAESGVTKLDLGDVEGVKKALTDICPDIILHCAGSADVNKSVMNPEADYYGNVTLTHNLLFALQSASIKPSVIYFSSAAVYGNPTELPIKETAQRNPLSPYALHKVMCEDMCLYFRKNYGIDIKIVRIFSAYGAGLKKQILWDMYCKSQTGKLNMFGTGNESRDYIHISDIANAIKLILNADDGEFIYNVANGEEITIKQIVGDFARAVGIREEDILFNGVVREGEPLNWCADIEKLVGLGYKKQVKLYDGIKNYIEWINQNK